MTGEPRMVPKAELRTYYDRPILKRPVWRWPIPAYFVTGGLAGASSMLSLGARMSGDRKLARRTSVTALASVAVSGALLVEDLGRPSRFANMLRVARPTSPMSVGSWLLAAYGPAAGAAALSDTFGVLPRVGEAGSVGAAVLGAAVTSYTAVLLSNTAIPAWHEARRELPFVFTGSAVASAGALALVHTPLGDAGPARRMALAGAAMEIGATRLLERRLGDQAEPYRTGKAGALAKAARAAIGIGALTVAVAGRRSRSAAALGGALVVAGSAVERFAIFEAGLASADDPKYVVGPQRARLDRRTGGTEPA